MKQRTGRSAKRSEGKHCGLKMEEGKICVVDCAEEFVLLEAILIVASRHPSVIAVCIASTYQRHRPFCKRW